MFFSMTFPAAAFFTIFAGFIRMSIELRGMSDYSKKDNPAPIMDIGIWMDLMNGMVNLGILITTYMILFTSKKAGTTFDLTDAETYYIVFFDLHLLFGIKYLLQEKIEDEPAWI